MDSPAMTIDIIMDIIKDPQNLGSFYTNTALGEEPEPLSIVVHRQTGTQEITIPQPFPFSTVYDVKMMIWREFKQSPLAVPEKQFLATRRLRIAGQDSYDALDFYWSKAGTISKEILADPFDTKRTKRQSLTYVDESGAQRILSYQSLQKMLFESVMKNVKENQLHLFFYDDIKASLGVISEKVWNGFLRPYFPLLSYENESPSTNILDLRFKKFTQSEEYIKRINNLLSTGTIPLSAAGIRLLKFMFLAKESDNIPTVESIFYSANVTKSRPYMRFKPTKGVEVVKLHLLKDNTPDLADPKLFKQWSRERNPTPENDYLMSKIVIKPMVAQQAPIYMTLQIFENTQGGSADATVLPPKGVRKLDLITDLDKFSDEFKKGLEGLPYANVDVLLKRASLIYGIHLPSESKSFSKRVIKERLKIFSAFFQEIPPLPGDQPLAMLRYKCVDNFATEDRIFSFLSQFATRKLEQGEGLGASLVSDVEKEFQLDTEEAKRVIAKWLQSKNDFEVVNPDTKEFIESNSTGIDIAIYAQHPWYKFHLYNVNSTSNLQRILTLLSVLFSASDLDLRTSPAGVAKIVETGAVLAKVEEKEDLAEQQDDDTEDIEADFGGDDMGLLGLAAEDFGTEGEEGEGEEESKSVADFVREDTVEPKEDLSAVKQIAKTAVPPAVALNKNENDDESVDTSAGEEGTADYFLTKLKEADKRLFDYTKTHPSLKKYVSMCAANVTRQPAVLSREQFEEMRDVIYANDIDKLRINFVVFPKSEEDTAKNVKGGAETFYFLRYGTTERKFNENYYTCAKCFCIRDNLVIIEEDYLGTKQRLFDGTVKADGTKPPKTCPFCLGVEVRNRRNPGPNETVILREIAPKTKDRYHTYVGFLKKTPHPEGFYLPCCFIKPSVVKFTDKYYDKQRAFGSDMRPGKGLMTLPEEVEGEEEISVVPTATKESAAPISKVRYLSIVAGVSTRYIVGSEKLPLEIDEKGPQIGLLPPMLDEYFQQGKEDLIDVKLRSATKQHQLKKKEDGGARGFLRLGVENRVRFKSDSFLSAIAPFYMLENAEQMKDLILQSFQLQPSIYFQLNYGNFLLEYYDSTQERPSWPELQAWLESTDTNNWSQILDVQNPANRTVDLHRFYISYKNFENWLFDDSQQKEYRQFASLLAQPGFLLRLNQDKSVERPGITFIVLDITEDNKVKVRCPPYGYNPILHANNDIAFLMHHYSGVWEPIVFVDTRSTYEPYSFFFQKANEAVWPDVVKQRVSEFMSESGCFTRGKLSFASQMAMNPKRMVPSSKLYRDLSQKGIPLDGMLRDAYNHLSALIFRDPENPKDLIPIPCVDNGFIVPSSKIYLDIRDLVTADPMNIQAFYEKHIVKQYAIFGDFRIKELWYTPMKEKLFVRGLLLKNNLVVPLSYKKPLSRSEFEGVDFKLVEKRSNEFEWIINRYIVADEDVESPEESNKQMTTKDVNDIFEHLRITFANWLSMKGGNSTVRKEMEDIIFDDEKNLYEKRRDMEVLLSKDIMSWFSSDEQLVDVFPSLQRVDCRGITSGDVCKAHGRCVWKTDEEKCLIHTPEKFEMPQTKDTSITVDFKRLLLFRLIEELLRFAERRRELLENDVSYTGTIDRPIRQGDQYIIPKNTMVWYELLRGDWVRTTDEKPKYFEEMSVVKTEELSAVEETTKLPVALETFLKIGDGVDPAVATFRLYRKPFEELFPEVESKESFTKEELETLSKKRNMPLAQIDLRVEPSEMIVASVRNPKEYIILVLTDSGPALMVRDPSTGDLPSIEQLPKKLATAFEAAKPKIRPVLKALEKKIKPVLKKPTLYRKEEGEE